MTKPETYQYKELIEDSFKKLKFTPRPNQIKIIDDVVTEFINNKKRNVILCADTGLGKSIIAAVVAECLNVIDSSEHTAIYLSSTNALVNQYADTFEKLGDDEFFRIKGSTNYPCNYFIHAGNSKATGDDCVKKHLSDMEQTKFCSNCSYTHSRNQIKIANNLITNYAYFMLAKMNDVPLGSRNLQVFDEAHLLNDVFCSQVTITCSIESINFNIKDCQSTNGKCETQIADLILFKNDLHNNFITHNNYLDQIKKLYEIYHKIYQICDGQAKLIPSMADKSKFKKISGKFESLAQKISDFLSLKYDHVFDNTEPGVIHIKPIFVNEMMYKLLGKFNLFMTATMSPEFAKVTMNLDKSTTAYVDAKQVFPSENRPLLFIGKDNLNYNIMKDPQTFVNMSNVISHILDHHKTDKGIILTPSFYVNKLLSSKIPKTTKLFEHVQGTAPGEMVKQFKAYQGSAVMISPSMFEGLDFPDDESRFQIIVKTPYASIGDPRIKRIANEYGNIYKEIALYKILQGIGRSIRSEKDHAVTYMLDKSTKTLFDSNLNLWSNRFLVKN